MRASLFCSWTLSSLKVIVAVVAVAVDSAVAASAVVDFAVAVAAAVV